MKLRNTLSLALVSSALVACGGSGGGSGDRAPLLNDQALAGMNETLVKANEIQSALETLKKAPRKVPFLARLMVDEEELLATQGDVSVKAACKKQPEETTEKSSFSPGQVYVEISYLSQTDGALLVETDSYIEANINYVVTKESTTAGLDIDEGSILAASGDFISVNGETMMLSTNTQGTDCMVAGIAMVMQGVAAPEFTVPEGGYFEEEQGEILPPPPEV